ncbi:FERM domain-containing protein 6 isoform X2 [Electrophorus electricus]|uniref:FERM domain-containing protein 6 isoform X2 n=1 Tax=Electrophorus electricus TaxID=8005 RepID=UPI0015D034CF|nr:FERM domain-containing protein 6 isoform X2 [Electrophorus electricus]
MSNQTSVLCVVLPTKKKVDVSVGLKCRGQDVINQLCALLGIKELQYFGLNFGKDNDCMFLDLEKKITTYFPRAWKQNTLQERIVLHLKVQYYIRNGQLITDETARSLYYADLKGNVLSSQCCDQEGSFFQLAAYALQAELGDWSKGKGSYFSPHDYFPPWIVSRWGSQYVLQHTPGLHRELTGMSARDAALLFIQEACSLSDVPLTFYSMSKGKKEQSVSVLLGLTLNGLHVYEIEMVSGKQQLFYDFFWSSIDRLTFQGRRFEIKADPLGRSKLVLHTRSTLHSQHVLKHISNYHRVHLHTRCPAEEFQPPQHRAGRRPREVCIRDSTDPDPDDSEDELPAVKSFLDKIRQCRPDLVGSLSVLNPREREGQEVKKSDFKEVEMCVDEPEMYVDDPEELRLLTELLEGVSVDGPPLILVPHWTEFFL